MSVVHGSFTVERHYPVPPARAFHAFADPATVRRWFVEGDGWDVERHEFDLRPGGGETSEQGAYFDDPQALESREAGTEGLLDALGTELARG